MENWNTFVIYPLNFQCLIQFIILLNESTQD